MEIRDTARAADGHPLAVTRFPAEGARWGTLLVAPAMGVPQSFYEPMARRFATRGLAVLTFDWRGTGASATGPMADCKADLMDWARLDLEAMLAESRAAAPDKPAFALGHSLGGQLLGATRGASDLRAAVTVTAGTGWYRHNDRMPWRVRFFWFVAIPVLTPLAGFFPGRRFGLVGDLPAGVAWQWRRWSTHPDYLLSEGENVRERFDAVRGAILGYSFTDDDIITRPAVDQLHGFYRHAAVERRHVAPAAAGRARIGHFGFFRPESADGLWEDTLAWLRAKASA